MTKQKSVLWLMLGIIGAFSIGYYVLPIFFQSRSGLDLVDKTELIEVMLMVVVFFASLIFGSIIGEKKFRRRRFMSLHLHTVDLFFIRSYKFYFFLGFIIWITYYFNNDLTSYSSADFEAFFHERSVYTGLLSALSNISLSVMSISIALAFRQGEKIKYLMGLIYLVVILLLLVTAQRLTVITPIFMLVAALSIYGNYKLCLKVIAGGIFFLILISPLMVFLREFQGDRGKEKIFEATNEYKSISVLDESFNSILKRADLLFVMTELKKRYDNTEQSFNHAQYFSSVIFSIVPRSLYNDKPYPLSDDGTIDGEISVQAWKFIKGESTGSLTAFGSISAYREGGWIWVVINGFLTGILFAWIYFYLAKGGHIAKFLFVSIFVTLCVKNIPPSLFYFIVFIAPTIQLIFCFYLLNTFLKEVLGFEVKLKNAL